MIYRPDSVLRRFAVQVFKSNPIVPASGATIKFYKQGATVKAAIVIPHNAVGFAQVYNTGALAQVDMVQINADESKTLTVDAVDPDAGTVDLTNQTGANVSLAVGDRLVRVARASVPDPALIYDDPLGSTAGAGSKVVGAEGWVTGYLREYRYDYTVTGFGVTPSVHADAEGSWVM